MVTLVLGRLEMLGASGPIIRSVLIVTGWANITDQ